MNFFLSWLGFAFFWYLMASVHGDIEYFSQLKLDSDSMVNVTHTPCVTEIKDFINAFLFSLETQATIGKFHFENVLSYS
jgi:potassium inwardly-rectifying channel subfamily J, other